jgi:DNA-binding CsgD family transcriptional regulator
VLSGSRPSHWTAPLRLWLREEQDRVLAIPVAIDGDDTTRERVARLAATGRRPSAIAAEFGIARTTVSFHLGNLGAANATPYATASKH